MDKKEEVEVVKLKFDLVFVVVVVVSGKGMQSLLNVLLSVLVPVLILEHCSSHGPGLLDLGPYLAMAIALAFPIGVGILSAVSPSAICCRLLPERNSV